ARLEIAGTPAESGERRIERDVGSVVCRVVIAPTAVGLPQLDQCVLDVLAIAVEHSSFYPDPFPDGLRRGQHVLTLAGKSHREVRTDRLRRRLHVRAAAHGVAPAPRRT